MTVEFEVSTTVNRPPEDVFEYLTDPANVVEWNSQAVEVPPVEEDMGVGTIWRPVVVIEPPHRTMTVNNKELAHQFIDAWNDCDWDRFRALTTDDWVLHAEFSDEPLGIDQYIEETMKEERASLFLDTNVHIEKVFDGGDHFTVLFSRTGTVGEEYGGFDVTEDTFEHPGMSVHRVEDGLVAEMWGVQDHGKRLDDLGILPEN